jgi:hypothetical protein
MPYEFITKNGLISQGNVTVTGSLITSQNVTASNISVSGYVSASLFVGTHSGSTFGTSSWATNSLTASNLVVANSYTVTNLTASGVVRAAKIAEKVVTFTPLTGSLTGAPAWYRIISGSGVADYGRVRLSTTFDNSRSDLEFTYGVRNYDTDGAGAFINITRASTYNSVFNAVRVIEGTLTTPYAIDVLIGNYLNNTTPDTVTCLYESQFIGAVLDTPTFVSASATGSNSNVVKTVYTTYASGYPRIGPTYSDGLAVATVQGQLTVGYRGNYAYHAPSTLNYALLVSGSVGIGTTSPSEKLTVSGSSYIIGGTGAVGTGTAYYLGDSSNKDISLTRVGAASLAIGRYFPSAWVETIRFTADGNVGIGTTSPNGKLHVVSPDSTYAFSVAGATKGVRFNINSNGTAIQGVDNTLAASYQSLILGGLDLYFQTNGVTNAMYINSSGNVGIGTTSPSEKLHVVGNGLITSGSAVDLRIDVSGTGNASLTIDRQTTGAESKILLLDGNVSQWGIAAKAASNNFVIRDADSTERFTILKSGGNVGIGTSSPASKLHISGSGQTIMRLDSDTTSSVSQFQIKAASDAVLIMGMQGGSAASTNFGVTAAGQAYFGTSTLGSPHPTSLVIGNVSNIPIVFSTTNTERMRILSDGNVGIGTTSPLGKLHVYGLLRVGGAANEQTGIIALGNDANPTGTYGDNGMFRGGIGTLGSSNYTNIGSYQGIVFNVQNAAFGSQATRMIIDVNGNVGIGTTNPTARLHVSGSTIISGSLNVTANITCLSLTETSTEAVKYNILPLTSQLENVLKLKPVSFNYKTNDKHSIGLIAEEVAKIYPEFTSDNNDSISYGKITSVLIQSIKELKNIIDNQQKQIEDLSNKLK